MNIGIQTMRYRIGLMSLSIMLKNTTLSILQMCYLKSKIHATSSKFMLLYQTHLHWSLIRKIKIKTVCCYYKYTHFSYGWSFLIFGKSNISCVGMGYFVDMSTSVWELFFINRFLYTGLVVFSSVARTIYHNKPVT